MLRFDVGDEVHVINGKDECYDRYGYVAEIDYGDPWMPYWVCFPEQGDGGEDWYSWFEDNELEPTEVPSTVPTEDLI